MNLKPKTFVGFFKMFYGLIHEYSYRNKAIIKNYHGLLNLLQLAVRIFLKTWMGELMNEFSSVTLGNQQQ